MRRIIGIFTMCGAFLTLTTCSNFFASLDPKAILIAGTEFTLEWDAPRDRDIEPGVEPDHYQLYYRGFGTSGPTGWTQLGAVDASGTLEYTVTAGSLPPGWYTFAVTTVTGTGVESELHESIDSDADPRRGWYIDLGGS